MFPLKVGILKPGAVGYKRKKKKKGWETCFSSKFKNNLDVSKGEDDKILFLFCFIAVNNVWVILEKLINMLSVGCPQGEASWELIQGVSFFPSCSSKLRLHLDLPRAAQGSLPSTNVIP